MAWAVTSSIKPIWQGLQPKILYSWDLLLAIHLLLPLSFPLVWLLWTFPLQQYIQLSSLPHLNSTRPVTDPSLSYNVTSPTSTYFKTQSWPSPSLNSCSNPVQSSDSGSLLPTWHRSHYLGVNTLSPPLLTGLAKMMTLNRVRWCFDVVATCFSFLHRCW